MCFKVCNDAKITGYINFFQLLSTNGSSVRQEVEFRFRGSLTSALTSCLQSDDLIRPSLVCSLTAAKERVSSCFCWSHCLFYICSGCWGRAPPIQTSRLSAQPTPPPPRRPPGSANGCSGVVFLPTTLLWKLSRHELAAKNAFQGHYSFLSAQRWSRFWSITLQQTHLSKCLWSVWSILNTMTRV